MVRRIVLVVGLTFSAARPEVNWATYAEYALSFASFGTAAKNAIEAQRYMNLPDASKQSTEFVHERLKLHNVPNWDTIKVKVGHNYGAVGNSLIMLMKSEEGSQETVLDLLLEQSKNGATAELREAADRSLLFFKAILSHEAHHILENDAKMLTMSLLSIPIATYIGSIFLEKGMKGLLPAGAISDKVPSYLKNTYKILKGISRHYVSSLLYLKLSRAIEMRADSHIPGDAQLLRAYRDFLYSLNNGTRELVKKKIGDKMISFYDTNRVFYEIQNFLIDPMHPSPLTRIKNIEEQLAAAMIDDQEKA